MEIENLKQHFQDSTDVAFALRVPGDVARVEVCKVFHNPVDGPTLARILKMENEAGDIPVITRQLLSLEISSLDITGKDGEPLRATPESLAGIGEAAQLHIGQSIIRPMLATLAELAKKRASEQAPAKQATKRRRGKRGGRNQ